MCYYVLVILKASTAERLGPLASRLGRWPELDHDRRLRAVLQSWGGEWATGQLAVYHTNPGRCACGWYFPPAARGGSAEERLRKEEERLSAKYWAKGWTQAKIERAMSDWRAAMQRRAVRDDQRRFVSDLVADVADVVGEIGVVPIWCDLGDSGEVLPGEQVQSIVVRGEDEHELGARFAVDEVSRVVGARGRRN